MKEVGPPHDRSYVVRCSLKNPKNEVSNARDVVWAAQSKEVSILVRASFVVYGSGPAQIIHPSVKDDSAPDLFWT